MFVLSFANKCILYLRDVSQEVVDFYGGNIVFFREQIWTRPSCHGGLDVTTILYTLLNVYGVRMYVQPPGRITYPKLLFSIYIDNILMWCIPCGKYYVHDYWLLLPSFVKPFFFFRIINLSNVWILFRIDFLRLHFST